MGRTYSIYDPTEHVVGRSVIESCGEKSPASAYVQRWALCSNRPANVYVYEVGVSGSEELRIFHFSWNFWKFIFFQHFDTYLYGIKTLKFSRQLGIQG